MRSTIILLVFLWLMTFIGCIEFISVDISQVEVPILAPKDSLYIAENQITFWWEENVDAESYGFQLASPGFDNPLSVVDTSLVGNLHELTLGEGRYAWRVRIENESSTSAFISRKIFIDQTPPTQPILLFPLNDQLLSLASDDLTLQWTSQDVPLDGVVFPVVDSVFLYLNSTTRDNLLQVWELPSLGTSSLPIKMLLETLPNLKDTSNYVWQILSKDQAGNRTQITEGKFRLIL
ncbi:MAG: hypothetical protein AAFP89_16110 [Bacteroidota bacterium]